MRNKKSVLVVLMMAMVLLTLVSVSPVCASASDVVLEPVSGSNCDPTTFEYNEHTVAEGFAAAISADLPFSKYAQIKFGCAVAGLGDSWEERRTGYCHIYDPYVKEMCVQVTGEYPHYSAAEDAIFDNTGTGGSSCDFLSTMMFGLDVAFAAWQIYDWLAEVYQEPLVEEWQYDGHWSKAIVRQGGWKKIPPTYVPWLDTDNKPRLQTAGANCLSTFQQEGPSILTITAQAEIYVQDHDYLYGGVVQTYVGTYEVSFEVEVPVGIYDVSVRTYCGQQILYDVPFWVDNEMKYSPDTIQVGYGTHSVKVESSFVQNYRQYVFQYWDWEGGSTDNPRTVNVVSDVTLRAYYLHVYTLYLAAGQGGTTSPAPAIYEYVEGTSVTVTALPYSSYKFKYWLLDGTVKSGNPITVTMNSDHGLKACFQCEGYCPILFVWNGTDYDEEGLLDIHNPDGTDLVYNHTLITEPAWTTGRYQLRLVEHPKTHSYMDQVKLYAVLEDGAEIELPLTYAWHSEHGNVLPQLLFSDEWKTDTLGADLNNGKSQSIDLKFQALPPNLQATTFIFQIEGNNALPK
jgi:hypothetical protein